MSFLDTCLCGLHKAESALRRQILFILSLRDLQGEIMVNIVEDWREMKDYAADASRQTGRAYQVSEIETPDKNKVVQLRVQVGKFGFQMECPDRNDSLYREIVAFCQQESFLNVSKTIPDDQFFK